MKSSKIIEKKKSRRNFIGETFHRFLKAPVSSGFKINDNNFYDSAIGNDAFIGELTIFPYNFAPQNWCDCNGSLLQISQYEALFSLISTTYGGDGQTTFAVPNFQGCVPVGAGAGPTLTTRTVGESGGSETVALQLNQLPEHNHVFVINNGQGTSPAPGDNFVAAQQGQARFNTQMNTALNSLSVSQTGGGQPINIMQPFLAVRICICVNGIYPSFS